MCLQGLLNMPPASCRFIPLMALSQLGKKETFGHLHYCSDMFFQWFIISFAQRTDLRLNLKVKRFSTRCKVMTLIHVA